MGLKSHIEPRKVHNHGQERWRVIVPMDLRRSGGKKMFFYHSEKEAAAKCHELMDDRQRVAKGFHSLTEQGQALVLEALSRVNGDPWKLLVAIERMSSAERLAEHRTIQEVVNECLKSKEDKGVRKNSYISTKSMMLQFATFAGEKGITSLSNVTPSFIEKWANSGGWSAGTRITYLTGLRTLFHFAVKRGYIPTNPALGVEKPMREERAPGIHNIEQVKALLRAALQTDPGLLGYICPLYFGGHRPRGASEIDESDVTAQTILVPGKKNKGRQHRFIEINPTLAKWLKVKGIEFGPLNLRRRMDAIRKIAGGGDKGNLPWPHDVLRHTFCSNAMPKYGATKTALMAGHSEKILVSRYYEPVNPEDVKKFWALTPRSVLGARQ